jgi:hypothetical protein
MKKTVFAAFYAFILILQSLFFLFLFFASGHQFEINDIEEIKMFIEIGCFLLSAVALLNYRRFSAGSYLLIIMFIALQTCYVDYYIEISEVNFVGSQLIVTYFILIGLTSLNLYFLYLQVRSKFLTK